MGIRRLKTVWQEAWGIRQSLGASTPLGWVELNPPVRLPFLRLHSYATGTARRIRQWANVGGGSGGCVRRNYFPSL
jgi:hypothetical protein